MRIQSLTALGLLLGLSLLPVALAKPPADAESEINYLLSYIENSGCDFYRNGTWYDSKKARTHLHDKYDVLVAGNRINTAEDFIEKTASESSLSGRPYEVRCGAGDVVPSNRWLRDALARYRLSMLRNVKPS
jgi:hypothetical protein